MIQEGKSVKIMILYQVLLILSMVIIGCLLLFNGTEGRLIIGCEAVIFIFGILVQGTFLFFLKGRNKKIQNAARTLQKFMQGDSNVRLDSNEEGEIAKFFEEINHLVLSLHSHMEREKHQKEFLKETISNISHQLKTPLTAMRMYHDIMNMEINNPETMDVFLNKTEASLDRMDRLVQNLMKLAKLDTGTIMLEKKKTRVKDLILSVYKEFEIRTKLEGKAVAIIGNEAAVLYCDIYWVTEAVSNLIQNAFEHTKAGDTIEVSWTESPVMVRIIVEDNGEGIHGEDIHHIFKRFYRSRFSKNTQGVGLGLALTKSIVEAHGGCVNVSSKEGKGTSFSMEFLKMT